ncbi:type II secretion system F family protein [Terrabacter sp. BE26]|uniref:type II secretion system F family protein n=1 Tax=Terrabacter sp. BE26 TaxID=2898152 RepID=UPI0035BE99AD
MSGWDLVARLPDGGVPTVLAAGLVAGAVLVLLGGREASGAAPAGGSGQDPVAPTDERAAQRRRRRLAAHLRPRDAGQRRAGESEVASALALLALAYRSGLPTWDVLDAVADGMPGPVATDLQQVAAALRWGGTESEAWTSVGPTWAPAARAVAVAHQAGVPPGPMLLAAADDLRGAELERLEVSAARVGVRLVAPLGLVLLPAFCLTTVAPLVIALAGDLLEG